MPNPIPIVEGVILTGSLVTYYTVPATNTQLKSVQLTGIRFVNTDSVARTVTLHVIPAGGSASDANVRFKALSIPAGMSLLYDAEDVLLPGGFIQCKASTASVVILSANGVSYP